MTRLAGRRPGEPAITSPLGSRLGLENWKRSVKWRQAIAEIGRPTLRVHDPRYTYASLTTTTNSTMWLRLWTRWTTSRPKSAVKFGSILALSTGSNGFGELFCGPKAGFLLGVRVVVPTGIEPVTFRV